jgi:hypothetical protein
MNNLPWIIPEDQVEYIIEQLLRETYFTAVVYTGPVTLMGTDRILPFIRFDAEFYDPESGYWSVPAEYVESQIRDTMNYIIELMGLYDFQEDEGVSLDDTSLDV